MSLRYEQYRSLWETRRLLYDILAGRAGHDAQERASCCLRHFPYLDKTGQPLFSKDNFETPDLTEDGVYLGYEQA